VRIAVDLSALLVEHAINAASAMPGPEFASYISHDRYVLLASTESSYVIGMVYGATGGQLLP
jgi:hypothetical protein